MHTHDLRLSEVLDEYLYDEPGLGESAIRKTRVAIAQTYTGPDEPVYP